MKNKASETDLEALFQAARSPSTPNADLVARVLADAEAVQTGFAQPAVTPSAPAAVESLWDTLGGWLGLSGLAAACAMGLVVGVILPGQFDSSASDSLAALLSGEDAVAFVGFEAVGFAEVEAQP